MSDAKRHAERALGAAVQAWLDAVRDEPPLPVDGSVLTTHAVRRNDGPVYNFALSVERLADFDTKEN